MSLTRNVSAAATSHYKDEPSYVLESDVLRAEFVSRGGRMVSLRHKPHGFELLYQQAGDRYVKPEYAKPLMPAQSAGFDDMFPNINECFCDEDPWKGTVFPDHGEAWSLDWDLSSNAEELCMSYHGVRLPYRLTRRVSFEGPTVLRMDYRLENLSPFPFSYIWSAHPMVVARAGTRFAFPDECGRAITVVSESGRLGSYGDEVSWPIHTDSKGTEHNLSLVREPEVHDHEEYFFKDRLSNGWCSVSYPEPGLTLTLTFPAERLPYAAVVLGEGRMHNKDSFLLLEPCTAPFDRVDFSKQYTSESKIGPHQTIEWFLKFAIDESTRS